MMNLSPFIKSRAAFHYKWSLQKWPSSGQVKLDTRDKDIYNSLRLRTTIYHYDRHGGCFRGSIEGVPGE